MLYEEAFYAVPVDHIGKAGYTMLTAVVLAIFGLLFIWFALWASHTGQIEWIFQAGLVLTLVLVAGLAVSVLGLYTIVIICLIAAVFALFHSKKKRKFW